MGLKFSNIWLFQKSQKCKADSFKVRKSFKTFKFLPPLGGSLKNKFFQNFGKFKIPPPLPFPGGSQN